MHPESPQRVIDRLIEHGRELGLQHAVTAGERGGEASGNVSHYAASSHGPSVTTDNFFINGIRAAAITVPITATIPSFMNRFV